MKVLGKNVVIATKKICVEHTSKIQNAFDEYSIVESFHKGVDFEKNIIFIIDKNGYYVDLRDTDGVPSILLKIFGSVPRYKSHPTHVGDKYIDDVQPFFSICDGEKLFELKELVEVAKNKNHLLSEENQTEI